jgi:glyoxylase-like metal-dependent hydrolase (beta-lactamase superfamily II)
MTSTASGKGKELRKDVYYYTNQIVNVIMTGEPGKGDWVLIDAGMPRSGSELVKAAEERFGAGTKPAAILLTHGHFDHVGGIVHLIETWNVPVFAHHLEAPFLTGAQAYPDPDTSVEGGLLAKISAIYPTEPVDITPALQLLPEDGTVPFLPGWRWLHVPGHAPGQVAFYRAEDGTLIPGDAFVTVRQDSMYKVLIQQEELNGPPRYLTTDWQAAWDSVKKLEALEPQLAITGHGPAMEGAPLKTGLRELVEDFPMIAIPDYGKYLDPDEPEFK